MSFVRGQSALHSRISLSQAESKRGGAVSSLKLTHYFRSILMKRPAVCPCFPAAELEQGAAPGTVA